ncbi:hypothetical protein JCM16303_007043 [Sporobolomyces ruberrimus]
MASKSSKGVKSPILEDDDPFAATRLPVTWISRIAYPGTPNDTSPASPPPFSALLPSYSPGNLRISFSSPPKFDIVVDPEPVTPRKPSPAAYRHPQYYEFSSNVTTSGTSDASLLFRSAPYPPPRLDQSYNVTPSTAPRPRSGLMTQARAHGPQAARFASLTDIFSPPTLKVPSTLASIGLTRTTTEPLYPGSTFTFEIALGELPESSFPLVVDIVFTGSTISSDISQKSSTEHLLFRLSSSVEMSETTWTGIVAIPLSSRCITCDVQNETLPWSFRHRGEDGHEWETSYSIVASCDGFLEAKLDIELGFRLPRTNSLTEWTSHESFLVEGGLEGWKLASNPEIAIQPVLRNDTQSLAPSTPLKLKIRSKFRFVPTVASSSTNCDTLFSAFSPASSHAILESLLRPDTIGKTITLGGKWHSRRDDFHFDMSVQPVDHASGQASTVVEVSREWIIDARAVVLAYSTSCAGYEVGFRLAVHLNTASTSAGGLRLQVPFLPEVIATPDETESLARTSFPLSPPVSNYSELTELPSALEHGPKSSFTEALENKVGDERRQPDKVMARSRWNRLRHIFGTASKA